MDKFAVTAQLKRSGAIAIIRLETTGTSIRMIEAIRDGGLNCVEITMNTKGALETLTEVRNELDGVLMGVGTVLDGATARQAILAGADFLVSPTVKQDVIEMAQRYGKVAVIGAMTPSEILNAWEMGADLIKVFPAALLGSKYISVLHGPLPQIPLVPTGGITAENAGEYIKAGAAVVCAADWLINKTTSDEGSYETLGKRAGELAAAVRKARDEMSQ